MLAVALFCFLLFLYAGDNVKIHVNGLQVLLQTKVEWQLVLWHAYNVLEWHDEERRRYRQGCGIGRSAINNSPRGPVASGSVVSVSDVQGAALSPQSVT